MTLHDLRLGRAGHSAESTEKGSNTIMLNRLNSGLLAAAIVIAVAIFCAATSNAQTPDRIGSWEITANSGGSASMLVRNTPTDTVREGELNLTYACDSVPSTSGGFLQKTYLVYHGENPLPQEMRRRTVFQFEGQGTQEVYISASSGIDPQDQVWIIRDQRLEDFVVQGWQRADNSALTVAFGSAGKPRVAEFDLQGSREATKLLQGICGQQ